MSPLHISFSFSFSLFFLFLLFPQRARAAPADCSISSCSTGPPVRFPFRLRRIQPFLCGYPGFDLSCNQTQLTTITLPGSGAFLVKHIDYRLQTLWINDASSCLPKRLLSLPFSLHDTPFSVAGGYKNYTFLNCSSSQTTSTLPATAISISCLSGRGYTVYAVPSSTYYAPAPAAAPSSSASPEFCPVISTALIPRGVTYEWEVNMAGEVTRGGIAVTWTQPDCSDCEAAGKNCGLDTDTSQIMCYKRKKSQGSVLPRGAKYGIIIGVGIPGLLFIIAIANYIYSRIFGHRHRSSTEDLSTSSALQSANVVVGLDAPTIESYPKTLLGESRRLPRANDNTCSICLGEYQPKEALRTIPECNHYFHANCIDEWLKLNASCPVCRKSPDGSSHVTPSSSVSSSTSSSLI